MATLKVDIELTMQDGDVATEHIGPGTFEITVEGHAYRRVIELEADTWTALDPAGVAAPVVWLLLNLDETNDITIAVGGTDVVTLKAGGPPNLLSSASMPAAKPKTGNPKLLVAAYE